VKDAPCHIKQNAVVEAWLAFRRSKDARFRSVRDRSHTLQFNAGKVYLELFVKVRPHWRRSEHLLRDFGYRVET
jgi:hypothetical protein